MMMMMMMRHGRFRGLSTIVCPADMCSIFSSYWAFVVLLLHNVVLWRDWNAGTGPTFLQLWTKVHVRASQQAEICNLVLIRPGHRRQIISVLPSPLPISWQTKESTSRIVCLYKGFSELYIRIMSHALTLNRNFTTTMDSTAKLWLDWAEFNTPPNNVILRCVVCLLSQHANNETNENAWPRPGPVLGMFEVFSRLGPPILGGRYFWP